MTAATAIVADDEPLLRASLKAALAEAWPALEIVAEASNGQDAVHAVREHRPAFTFLDIEMPLMNGLEAAREVRDLTQVVFVTAYDRYAVEAFERGAAD
ncbi:MAG TPA: response regulator, partial [Usitatibacter sp.]